MCIYIYIQIYIHIYYIDVCVNTFSPHNNPLKWVHLLDHHLTPSPLRFNKWERRYPEAKLTCSRSYCMWYGEVRYEIECSSISEPTLLTITLTKKDRGVAWLMSQRWERTWCWEARSSPGYIMQKEQRRGWGEWWSKSCSKPDQGRPHQKTMHEQTLGVVLNGPQLLHCRLTSANLRMDLISCDQVQFISW